MAVQCMNATRRGSSRVKMAAPLATCTKQEQRSVGGETRRNSPTDEISVRRNMSVTTASVRVE